MLEGQPLAAKLVQLVDVAQNNIPDMADTYNDAISTMTESGEVHFADAEIGNGEIATAWTEAFSNMLLALSKTQQNLNDTATAVYHVVNSYIEQDDEASSSLEAEIEEHNSYANGTHSDVDAPDGTKDEVEPPANGSGYEIPDFADPELLDGDD